MSSKIKATGNTNGGVKMVEIIVPESENLYLATFFATKRTLRGREIGVSVSQILDDTVTYKKAVHDFDAAHPDLDFKSLSIWEKIDEPKQKIDSFVSDDDVRMIAWLDDTCRVYAYAYTYYADYVWAVMDAARKVPLLTKLHRVRFGAHGKVDFGY